MYCYTVFVRKVFRVSFYLSCWDLGLSFQHSSVVIEFLRPKPAQRNRTFWREYIPNLKTTTVKWSKYIKYIKSSLISVLTKFCELWIKSNEMHVCLGRLRTTRRVCWCRAFSSVVEKSNELRILPSHSCNSESVSKSKLNSPVYIYYICLLEMIVAFCEIQLSKKAVYFRTLHFRNPHWHPISVFLFGMFQR